MSEVEQEVVIHGSPGAIINQCREPEIQQAERETARGLFASGVAVVLWSIIAAAIWVMATGCTIRTQNDAEYSIGWKTTFVVAHTAKKTSGDAESDVGKSNTDFPAVEDWIKSKSDGDESAPPKPNQ